MAKQIKRIKIHIAYILCIATMPIVYIMDVLHQQKQVFVFARRNAKTYLQSNSRYYKINMKMLDML